MMGGVGQAENIFQSCKMRIVYCFIPETNCKMSVGLDFSYRSNNNICSCI